MNRCQHPGGGIASVSIGGYEVDPCLYQTVEVHHNVSVCLSRCVRCGNEMITWSEHPEVFNIEEE